MENVITNKYNYELQIKKHDPNIYENHLQNKFHWIVSFSLYSKSYHLYWEQMRVFFFFGMRVKCKTKMPFIRANAIYRLTLYRILKEKKNYIYIRCNWIISILLKKEKKRKNHFNELLDFILAYCSWDIFNGKILM